MTPPGPQRPAHVQPRPVLLASDWLRSLADTQRNGPESLVATDRANAVTALRSLPAAPADHPYPAIGGLVIPPDRLATYIEQDASDWLTPERLEDYGDALDKWDREEREAEDGERSGAA